MTGEIIMEKKLSSFERQLMLDEIMFYSICSDQDRQKILDQQPMTFQDFRRLSLLTDYLELEHLHRFIWDLHAYKFMDEMDELYNECKEGSEDLPEMLLETGHWLDDFWKQAPNITVSFLLRQIFSDGLKSRRKNNITLYPGPNRNKGNSPS